MDIQRGWTYLADLNPRQGTEPGKTRPVLVIQTDLLTSAGHPSCVILPLTTQVRSDASPLRVRIPAGDPGFDADSDVMVDQIRAIDNTRFYRGSSGRLIKKIAPLSAALLHDVEHSLSQVLDLPTSGRHGDAEQSCSGLQTLTGADHAPPPAARPGDPKDAARSPSGRRPSDRWS